MGRKPNEEKKFLRSTEIYEFGLRREILDSIPKKFNDTIADYKTGRKNGDLRNTFRLVEENLKARIGQLIMAIKHCSCLEELLIWLSKEIASFPIESSSDDSADAISSNLYKTILVDKYGGLQYEWSWVNHNKQSEREEPVLDIRHFYSNLDNLIYGISTKAERINLYYSLRDQLNDLRRKKLSNDSKYYSDIRLSRNKRLWVNNSVSVDMMQVLLDERIRSERIRLVVKDISVGNLNASIEREVNKENLRNRFESFQKIGIVAFSPFQSFLKSEFIFSKGDTLNVSAEYQIYLGEEISSEQLILAFMTLQGNTFFEKDKDLKNLFSMDLFDNYKRDFKYWLLGLNIVGVNETLVDKLLDKPLRRANKLFLRHLHTSLSKIENPPKT